MAEAGGGRVAVRGQADAFGSLARQGRRVARFVARLLERCGSQIEDGAATMLVRGRRGRLRLTGETLAALAPHPERAPVWADGWETPSSWDDLAVWAGIGPGQPSVAGWLVRRDPEPRAWADGVVTADLLLRSTGLETSSSVLVSLVRTPAQAARFVTLLPTMRGGEPWLFAGPDALLEPLREAGAWTVGLSEPALAPIAAVVATRAQADGPLVSVPQAPAAERRRRRVA